MKFRKIFLPYFVIAVTFMTNMKAQVSFEVPQSIELKTNDDYTKLEPSIIDAAKWLEETDLNKEPKKRQQVSAFVLQWVTGSPTVSIDLTESLMKIYGKNTDLLSIYLASFSRNFIENKDKATKFLATKAALLSIMKVYKKGINISKSKDMEKLIKLTNENKLDDYINTQYK